MFWSFHVIFLICCELALEVGFLKAFPILNYFSMNTFRTFLKGRHFLLTAPGSLLLLLLLSHFSRVRLCATPETAAHQAPPSLGFSRQEHWSGLPFPSPMHENGKWKWSRSVMSDPQRPHGLHPTRLLRPWNFPGKSTGGGCHCLDPYEYLIPSKHSSAWCCYRKWPQGGSTSPCYTPFFFSPPLFPWNFMSEYSWFLMSLFQVYRNSIQLYIAVYSLSGPFSLLGDYNVFNKLPSVFWRYLLDHLSDTY